MLVMNDKGMQRLLSTKFTLGGEASVAAGPVGRDTQAQTDAAMTAEILTWSRQRGLFGGVALTGATLRPDEDWNNELYGRKLTNREILTSGVAAPASVSGFLATLNKYSSRK
jgi:lipid-binding SYLF domain-containing protein